MTIDSKAHRVPPRKKVDLSEWPTIVAPYSESKKQYKDLLHQHMEKLSSLQDLHYASNQHALLLILQGMDVGKNLSGELTVETVAKDFDLLITAEQSNSVTVPSSIEVLRTHVSMN